MEDNLNIQVVETGEPIGVVWFFRNIWKHPLNTIWRIHHESSIVGITFTSLIIVLISSVPALVEIFVPQSITYPIAMQETEDRFRSYQIVRSLDYVLLSVGMLMPYLLLRLFVRISEFLSHIGVTSLLKIFGMMSYPFKILQDECVETYVNVKKARIGLLLSIVPIIIGYFLVGLSGFVFKTVMVPLYVMISPQYYDLYSIRNLEGENFTFLVGSFFWAAIFFFPSLIFVFRKCYQLTWIETVIRLLLLGIGSFVIGYIMMFFIAAGART